MSVLALLHAAIPVTSLWQANAPLSLPSLHQQLRIIRSILVADALRC